MIVLSLLACGLFATPEPDPGPIPMEEAEPVETQSACVTRDQLTTLEDDPPRVMPRRSPLGQVVGFKVSGVRADTPLARVGIKNGDVIHAVNDVLLVDQSAFKSLETTMREATAFTVELTRDSGARVRIQVSVEEACPG